MLVLAAAVTEMARRVENPRRTAWWAGIVSAATTVAPALFEEPLFTRGGDVSRDNGGCFGVIATRGLTRHGRE